MKNILLSLKKLLILILSNVDSFEKQVFLMRQRDAIIQHLDEIEKYIDKYLNEK